jgi:hypothetical protein
VNESVEVGTNVVHTTRSRDRVVIYEKKQNMYLQHIQVTERNKTRIYTTPRSKNVHARTQIAAYIPSRCSTTVRREQPPTDTGTHYLGPSLPHPRALLRLHVCRERGADLRDPLAGSRRIVRREEQRLLVLPAPSALFIRARSALTVRTANPASPRASTPTTTAFPRSRAPGVPASARSALTPTGRRS